MTTITLTTSPELKYVTTYSAPLERVLGILKFQGEKQDFEEMVGNFDKAYQAGARFVFIKASQATWCDEDFLYNWKSAQASGLYRGPYHFLDWTENGDEQGIFFTGLTRQDKGRLYPMADYECRTGAPSRNQAVYELRSFLDIVEDGIGLPGIYTGQNYWETYGTTDTYWLKYPLWFSWPSDAPPKPEDIPLPWRDYGYTFWQFTWELDGIKFGAESKGLDGNYYNGTWDEFTAQFGDVDDPPVEPPGDYLAGYTDGRADTLDELEQMIEEMR